ncbi:MAG: hypothetical protein INH41_01350 [Myxococcaceae bacterium]|nr:hypothetical protein [Myxococcaceae bacterium]MCA3011024.1 hypothetical protein [Myxococcaceae bacterium]
MGSSLTEAAAIFKVRGASPRAVTLQHQQLGPAATTGIFRALLGMGVAYGDLSAGKGRPDDFFFVTNASLTTAAIQRVQSGGLPGIVYDGTCGVTSIGARSFAIVGDGGVLLVGGNDEGLCEVEVNTNQSRVLQPEVQNGPGNDVTAIYQGADAGLFFTTEDGYVFKAGVGRVSPQLDTSSYGMVAIDGTAGGDIWAIGREGVVARLGDDGGFEPVATLGGPLYGVRVTPEGVYVTAYGALFLRTGTTDGGFSRVPLPTVGSVSRPYHLNAGPGYVHVSGDYGLFSSNGIPAGAFFMTFRTRSP